MSVPSTYYLHGIAAPGGTFISQLTDTTPSVNTQRLIGFAAGHPQPLYVATQTQRPEITFTGTAVKQILDLIAGGGNPYFLAISATPLDLYYIKGKDLSFREAAASAVHYRFRVTRGLLHWRTIRATQGGEATIVCRLVPIFDGVNAPIVPAGSLALTGTPAFSQAYTLGPVAVNTVALGGVQDWTLNLGEQEEATMADGDVWPSFCGLRSVSPTASIRAVGEPGRSVALTGASLTAMDLFLRAKAAGGGNVADGTSSHVKISASAGRLEWDSISSGLNSPAETSLLASILAPNTASNALTISTASAIS